jgi:hypothetical protein
MWVSVLKRSCTDVSELEFGTAAQRKLLEVANEALYFVLPRSENLLNCEQKYCVLFRRAAKILDCQENCTLFSRAAKFVGIHHAAKFFGSTHRSPSHPRSHIHTPSPRCGCVGVTGDGGGGRGVSDDMCLFDARLMYSAVIYRRLGVQTCRRLTCRWLA